MQKLTNVLSLQNIKFRAWHKKLKVMFNSIKQINFDYGGVWVEPMRHPKTDLILPRGFGFDEVELIQFTGIKDAEGREVFEGDILAYDHGGGVDCFIIERNPDDNQLHARYLYMHGYDPDYLADVPIQLSIIVGNRFENQNLLEVNNEQANE